MKLENQTAFQDVNVARGTSNHKPVFGCPKRNAKLTRTGAPSAPVSKRVNTPLQVRKEQPSKNFLTRLVALF